MPRVKSQVQARRKHKKIFHLAKGFYGRRKNTIRAAHQAVNKAGQNAFVGRKIKKRDYRSLWIQRINAAVRQYGITYGEFMHQIKIKNILIDRKMLAYIAYHNEFVFHDLIKHLGFKPDKTKSLQR